MVDLYWKNSQMLQTAPARMKTSLPPDNDLPLPGNALIVPGSFNPPHAGHVRLANATASALHRLRWRDGEGGGDNLFAKGHPSCAPSLPSASPPVPMSLMSSILRSMWDAIDGHMNSTTLLSSLRWASPTPTSHPWIQWRWSVEELRKKIGTWYSVLCCM